MRRVAGSILGRVRTEDIFLRLLHIYGCVSERSCVYAGDGWTGRTDDGEMGGFTCVRVCTCVCTRVRDPVCVCARMK